MDALRSHGLQAAVSPSRRSPGPLHRPAGTHHGGLSVQHERRRACGGEERGEARPPVSRFHTQTLKPQVATATGGGVPSPQQHGVPPRKPEDSLRRLTRPQDGGGRGPPPHAGPE